MTEAPTLRTARLTLRSIEATDVDAVVEMLAEPELSRFHDADHAGRWIFDLDGETVGLGRLQPSTDLPGVLEIDYYVTRPHRGTGIAREATEAMLRHAFDTLAAPAVLAVIDEPNAELVDRLGFVKLGSHAYVAFPQAAGRLHHVELWVPDLVATQESWGWLLTELGWTQYQRWRNGVSWRLGPTYLVFEDSPARKGDAHDRLRPGLNHIALHAGSPDRVEELAKAATGHGWRLMFADRHPYAGGPDHYAAYLENGDGYEVELVAS